MNKDQYLKLASSLSGEVLNSIEYFEIDYEDYESSFYENSEYDSLDYGVNFKMESGKVFGFIWGSEFTQYGVSILQAEIQSEVSACRKIDVSESENWLLLRGQEIEDVEVIWSWVKEVGLFKKKTYYPQSVVLEISGYRSIIISAMEITDDSHWGMADNIVVFFNKVVARRYRALNA